MSCGLCGLTVTGSLPLTWSTETSANRMTLLCDRCTRENLRAIEAKLEQAWW